MEKIGFQTLRRRKDSVWLFLLMAVCFVGIAALNMLFTKTCDDITFSLMSDASIPGLLNGALHQGNGRLFGNFFGYLIHYQWFTILEKTVIWTGIVYLMIKLVGSRSMLVNAGIAAVMIFPCDSIFAQVYAWNAGFQNYAFPVFLILLDVVLLDAAGRAEKKTRVVLLTSVMAATAFAAQFFSENSSLFAVCLGVLLVGVSVKTKKYPIGSAITYLVSTACGFALMMTYPHFLGTSKKIASYRQYADSLSGLIALARRNFQLIARNFAGYAVLWILLSAAFVLMIHKMRRQTQLHKTLKSVLFVCELIFCAYPAACLIYSLAIKTPITYPRRYFSIAMCAALMMYAVALLAVCIILLVSKDSAPYEKKSALLVLLAGVSAAPLLVVSPIGARTFYIPFVCLFAAAAVGLRERLEKIPVGKASAPAVIAAVCGVLAVLGMAELDNKYCANVRESYLAEAIENGNESVTLPLLPHQNLLNDDPNKSAWKNYIRKKYDSDIEFSFMEWNQWYNEYYRKQ